MSSMLSSQGFVLATAMAVSSTLVFLAFSRQKTFPPTQLSQEPQNKTALRSCLSSGDKKKERKKKKVQFADIVEEEIGGEGDDGVDVVMEKHSRIGKSCGNEIRRIPENRIALYNGILKNRVQRIECSH